MKKKIGCTLFKVITVAFKFMLLITLCNNLPTVRIMEVAITRQWPKRKSFQKLINMPTFILGWVKRCGPFRLINFQAGYIELNFPLYGKNKTKGWRGRVWRLTFHQFPIGIKASPLRVFQVILFWPEGCSTSSLSETCLTWLLPRSYWNLKGLTCSVILLPTSIPL